MDRKPPSEKRAFDEKRSGVDGCAAECRCEAGDAFVIASAGHQFLCAEQGIVQTASPVAMRASPGLEASMARRSEDGLQAHASFVAEVAARR